MVDTVVLGLDVAVSTGEEFTLAFGTGGEEVVVLEGQGLSPESGLFEHQEPLLHSDEVVGPFVFGLLYPRETPFAKGDRPGGRQQGVFFLAGRQVVEEQVMSRPLLLFV